VASLGVDTEEQRLVANSHGISSEEEGAMIYWAQLFHFYQPPTQLPPVRDPEAKATVNINGVLTEVLKDCGHLDIIQG
jgi:hypothetical protein